MLTIDSILSEAYASLVNRGLKYLDILGWILCTSVLDSLILSDSSSCFSWDFIILLQSLSSIFSSNFLTASSSSLLKLKVVSHGKY